MTNEYAETLIIYVRDYLFAESVRIMSTDYQDNTFNYYEDAETGEIKKLPMEIKDKILSALNEKIESLINDLKEFLISQQIISPKIYEDNIENIKIFINKLVEKQVQSIESIMKSSE